MDTISHNGEKLVKASDIARELGYTSDYVGQLCRAEKINAKLVGRSWYVSENSLRAHKEGRYRKTTEKSKAEIRRTLVRQESHTTQQHASGAHHIRVAYESDETDLFPRVQERNTVRLETQETPDRGEKVRVKVAEKAYTIAPAEKPNLKFKGTIAVSSGEELSDTTADVPEPSVAKPRTKKASVKKPRVSTPVQSVPLTVTEAPRRSFSRLATAGGVLALFILAFGVAGLLSGLESHVSITADSLEETYNFNLALVLDSLKYPFK